MCPSEPTLYRSDLLLPDVANVTLGRVVRSLVESGFSVHVHPRSHEVSASIHIFRRGIENFHRGYELNCQELEKIAQILRPHPRLGELIHRLSQFGVNYDLTPSR